MMLNLWICLLIGSSLGSDIVTVSSHLYGTVRLPCSFPFVWDDVTVVWERAVDGDSRVLVHKFIDGRDYLELQDSRCQGRTEMSKEFSRQRLDLTLKNVTYTDEGIYHCRATNGKGHGSRRVALAIDSLSADVPKVSSLYNDGVLRLKCTGIGVFHQPQVRWVTPTGEDISAQATLHITDLGDGTQVVESILEYDVETDEQYLCHISEGRLKVSTRAVLSDGSRPVTINDP